MNFQNTQYFNKTINWGMIGCGAVTEKKSAPAYQQIAGFQLSAVAGRNPQKLQDYAVRHKVPRYFLNIDEMINSPDIQAIYIATPPDSHVEYALKVANAGKIACIEKPLAPSYQACVQIVEAFETRKLPLFVAYYRRSLPRFEQIKSWLADGEIGQVRHVSWHLNKPANAVDLTKQENWRTNSKIAAGGYFDDLASHGLDLLIYLLGDIQRASGIATNQQQLYSAFDAITASWLHGNGVTGTGSWNFGCAQREDKVEIWGSLGKIQFSVFDDVPLVLTNAAGELSRYIENPENIQLFHVGNMRKDLDGMLNHPSIGKSAAHTSWVMQQIINPT